MQAGVKGKIRMKISRKIEMPLRSIIFLISLLMVWTGARFSLAQPPAAKQGPRPKMPFTIQADSRVEQRSYRFEETGEEMKYVFYKSSKVSKDGKAPLIVTLHGLGGDGNLFLGSKYPSDWAAIAAIAPAAFLMQENRREYLAKINDAGVPVMIVQGGKDTAVPAENTRKWIDTMKELGMKYEFLEISDGDHGTVISDGMPEIFRFFAQHPKKSAN